MHPRPRLDDPAWTELLPDAVCVMDTDYEIVSLLPGVSILDDCFHIADHDAISKALAESRVNPGSPVNVEARFCQDGTGWRHGVASVVDWTENPLIAGIVLRWRPLRALDGDEIVNPDSLRLALDLDPSAVWICDLQGHTVHANTAASALYGLPAGTRPPSLSSVLRGEGVATLLGDREAGDPPITIRAELDRSDAAVLDVVATSWICPGPTPGARQLAIRIDRAPLAPPPPTSHAPLAAPVAVPASAPPATPVAEAADALRRALTDALLIGVFELDEHMQLASANPAWREVVGAFATNDPFGWLGKVHADDRPAIDAVFTRPREGDWFHERYRIRRDVDEWAWVETKVTSLGDHGRHVGVTTDITSAVLVEEQIAAARDAAIETSQMKSEFLANMSHEIRTPLNGVIGMATLLLDTPLNRDQRERVVTLRSAGEHLLGLVNDILDFSKVETGKLELEAVEFDLLPVISQVVSLYSSAGFDKGVRLRVDTDASLPRAVVGDPSRLRQVLSNLVGNAIKFTEVGAVTIRVTAEGRRSTVVRFEVIDTGIGISPEAQAKIFEPFMQADNSTTRRFGGTGLGLPISRRLVELMGGMLSVDSRAGKGSTFWFTIPFGDPAEVSAVRVETDPQVIAASDGASTMESFTPRGRVLLVEDNPINQKVALGFLSHLGWEADVANDGLEGYETACHGTYSVILMDCQMPRMDGYEATGRIRAHERGGTRTPIIALTAGAMPGDRERCLDAGMDDYLSKPIDVSRLDALLRQWARTIDDTAVAETEGDDVEFGEVTIADLASDDEVSPLDEGLDPSIVEQLRSIPSGDSTLLDEALEQFQLDAPTRLSAVEGAATACEWLVMSRAAHAMKGMAAAVGAARLAEVADELQRAGQGEAPSVEHVTDLIERLAEAMQWALDASHRELSNSL